MSQTPYPYKKQIDTRFTFVSFGNRSILKVVEFTPTAVTDLFNLGFGDLLPNGEIDDTSNSNNGDIMLVLSTVIQILKDFTNKQPHLKVVFTGSTLERNRLYHRILKMYYPVFSKEFIISGLILEKDNYYEIPFVPENKNSYVAFFIKRII